MEKEKAPASVVDFSEFVLPSYGEWKEEAIASLKGAPFEKKLLTKTYEGIVLEPLYTAEHAAAFKAKSGLPGSDGYLRGTFAAGYSGAPWLIAQKGDAATVRDANAQLREALSKGATAICFDPRCYPELSVLDDIKELLNGVAVEKYPFQVYCGASAAPTLGLLAAYIKQAGIDPAALSGVIGCDPLGTLARKGRVCASIESYYNQMANCMRWAATNAPRLKTIFIQGAVYHEGGASAVVELAAMFAAAVSYLDALGERGFSVDEIAANITFSFSLGANFFMEIAKLRAARLIWSQLIAAYGGGKDAAKLDARAATSHFTATVYDPYVNILRATTQAFSGVVGGVSALTVEPFDAAIRMSDELSRRIARNVQVMMQNEFNLTSPTDPAGGAWFVETLTSQVAEAGWSKLQDIESQGGLWAALKSNSLQSAIAATLDERFKKLATRAERVVGSNIYADTEAKYERSEHRKQQLEPCRGEPMDSPVTPAADIEDCLSTVAAAFAKGASVAQVKAALNKGECETVAAIEPHRLTERLETLRIKTEEQAAKTGENITVFLANMGPLSQHKARADFSTGFMEVGGFTVLQNSGFADIKSAAAAAIASKAWATVICSTDETYPEIVPELSRAIKDKAPDMLVILAGAPAPEYKESYVEAGVDDFIHIKADCLSVLQRIQQAGGVK